MKTFLFSALTLSFLAIIPFNEAIAKNLTLTNKPTKKVLIAYYSQSGTKNTETIANYIHNAIGGDLYEIELIKPYPEKYKEILKQSKEENNNNIKPAIKAFTNNLKDYDIIFIGSPIWFGTYAPPIATFLADSNLQNKTVIPFCTHGGGGAGDFYNDIKKNAQNADVVEHGFTAKGSNVVERFFGRGTKNKVSQDDVTTWLNEIFKQELP